MSLVNMKVAFLCLAHNNFEYVRYLSEKLTEDGDYFFLHIDRNSSLPKAFKFNDKTIICNENERLRTRWGTFDIVEATLLLMNKAQKLKHFDHFILVSGQDYPLYSVQTIKKKIKAEKEYVALWEAVSVGTASAEYTARHYYHCKFTNPGEAHKSNKKSRIYLAYLINYLISKLPRLKVLNYPVYAKGSQWWCISNSLCCHFLEVAKNREIVDEFKLMHAPDEKFFHTIYVNSRYYNHQITAQEELKQGIHYIDWMGKYNKPQVFDSSNTALARKKGCLFSRKISKKLMETLKL